MRALGKLRYHLLGVAFLLTLACFVTLTIAFYRKAFTTTVPVTVQTDHIGNQMRVGADVKLRDVVVGTVSEVRSNGRYAEISLALQPDQLGRIPANVVVRLLPKSLFGERYVSLEVPGRAAAEPLARGAVIGQDRSQDAIETEKVLDDLLPVLQAVQPEKLSSTLHAVSAALDGRGKSIGETIGMLDSYLRRILPSIPDLTSIIADTPAVTDTYNRAGPKLLDALTDLTTTSRTLVQERAKLQNLFSVATTATMDVDQFLAANKDNLIHLVASSRPAAEVLAKYAPEYPCLFGQLADIVPKADAFYGKGTDHPGVAKFTMEITASRGQYLPGVDTPRYDDKRGPRCYDLSKTGKFPPQYPADGPFADGSSKPPGLKPGGGSAPAGEVANSAAEKELLGSLLAPRLAVAPGAVPGWAGLLVGPLYRGAEVTVS
ncbi:MCE family protein [Amycolatopsis sp. NPDC059021]|uniref:MCE family protein n=1 Tax=Amycolatopsis sp. NPDC059021 TaxID=3346704 RepID=UPI0036717518